MSDFLTPAEFASLLRMPEATVQSLCARGGLPGAHRVGCRWRIDMAEY